MNDKDIYYSEVTVLLEAFIFLFEPIYKNIYLTITKLDIFENRKILQPCHSLDIIS